MKKVSEKLNVKDSIIVELNRNFEKENTGSFKELINTLETPKKTLIKYTSLLKECSKEYENCKNCKGLFNCKNKIIGYKYTPKEENDNLEFEYMICDYKLNNNELLEYQKNIYYNSIPDRIMNSNFSDIYLDDKKRLDTIKWCTNFIKNYEKNLKGIYLTGNFGCGKSYILSATLAELAKRNIKSAIIFWPEFINDLKSSFQTDFKQKFELVKKVEILLIDDIGAENVTEWSRDEILSPLVQFRMENNLTTMFTSNLNLEQLENHFSITKSKDDPLKSRRIMERIKQLAEYKEMVSVNLRK